MGYQGWFDKDGGIRNSDIKDGNIKYRASRMVYLVRGVKDGSSKMSRSRMELSRIGYPEWGDQGWGGIKDGGIMNGSIKDGGIRARMIMS